MLILTMPPRPRSDPAPLPRPPPPPLPGPPGDRGEDQRLQVGHHGGSDVLAQPQPPVGAEPAQVGPAILGKGHQLVYRNLISSAAVIRPGRVPQGLPGEL